MKKKPEEVSMDIIMAFVEDILQYLENKEEEEYETNQYLVGIQELFRGYVIVVWEGIELSSKKYSILNEIVAKKCMEFYVKCWKQRNEILYDENKQRECVKKWYEKEKERAEKSDINQVREFAKKFKINIEQYNIDTIKKLIMNLKKIEKKVESVLNNNIRRYFGM